jgi:hypothetical protein
MNWDRVEGSWNEFKGQVKQQWGKLTDDDLDVIAADAMSSWGVFRRPMGWRAMKPIVRCASGKRTAPSSRCRIGAVPRGQPHFLMGEVR